MKDNPIKVSAKSNIYNREYKHNTQSLFKNKYTYDHIYI